MNSLWNISITPETINHANPGTIHESLGIQFTAVGRDYLEATMPVDPRTRQPLGLLHGGASVVLAESLGSIASLLAAGMTLNEPTAKMCVGIEINASHLRSVQHGQVTGRVTPVRLGKSLHVWNVAIYDTTQAPLNSTSPQVCQVRLTVMIKDL